MRPATPCRFYFKHFPARTPLAFSSQISLSEAKRIPRLSQLIDLVFDTTTTTTTWPESLKIESKTNGKAS